MTTGVLKHGVTLPSGPNYAAILAFLKLTLPVTTNLVGQYVFSGNATLSSVNIANPSAPLTVIGSPTVSALGAVCDVNNHFDTGLSETTAFSFLTICQQPNGAAMAVSNFLSGGTPTGSSLFFTNAVNPEVAVATTTTTTVTAASGTGAFGTDWYQQCVRADATSADSVVQRNNTLLSANSVSTGSRSLASRTLRIGGHYSPGAFAGQIPILFAAIWSQKLIDADRNSVMAYLRTNLNTLAGITTL